MKTERASSSDRAERKAHAIITKARELFYRDGYSGTSVDEISREARIGKATIYKHFGSKAELFAAVVVRENQHGLLEIQAILDSDNDVDARLNDAASLLVELLTAPDFIASYRMVMSEATRLPDLAALYHQGALQLLLALSDGFRTMSETGELNIADPLRAAEHFVGLVRGDLQLRALLGVTTPDADERKAIIASGVAVFLKFYGANADAEK